MNEKTVKIYTKVCLPCVWKSKWTEIQRNLHKAGFKEQIFRTTYEPAWHEEATKLWGSDNYLAFAVLPDGAKVAIGAIMKHMNTEPKDKLVKAGKKKPVRKGKRHDLRGLSETTRPHRKNPVENPPVQVTVETKTR